jgi:hypothetical protein
MRNVPLVDSSVGFEDIVGVAVGTLVAFVMLVSRDLVEGNSDTLVGKMLFVAVGYSVGSKDAGTPGTSVGGMLFVAVGCSVGSKDACTPGTSVGGILFVAVGYSVGSKDACTPGTSVGRLLSVAVGAPPGFSVSMNIGFRLVDGRREGGEEIDRETLGAVVDAGFSE